MQIHDPDSTADQRALHQTSSPHPGNTADQLSPQTASVNVRLETQHSYKPASELSSPQLPSVNVEMETHHLDNAAEPTSLAQTTSAHAGIETYHSYNAADHMSLLQSASLIVEIETQHPNEPTGQLFFPQSPSINVEMETQNLNNAADQTSLPQSSSINAEKATDLSDDAANQMSRSQKASIDCEMATDHSIDATDRMAKAQTILTTARDSPDSIRQTSNTPGASAAIHDSTETAMTTSKVSCVVCKATLAPGVTSSMCAHPESAQTPEITPFWKSKTKDYKGWSLFQSPSVGGHLSRPQVFIHAPNLEWPEPTAADLAPKLLTIPLEIRQKIFSFLLVAGGPIKIPGDRFMKFPSPHYQPEEIDMKERKGGGRIRYWEVTQPFLICRQLYHELMPMFFSLNTFEFLTALALPILEDFLRGMGRERRKYVGGIHLVDDSVVKEIQTLFWDRFCARRPPAKLSKKAYRLLGESRKLKYLSISVPGFDWSRHRYPMRISRHTSKSGLYTCNAMAPTSSGSGAMWGESEICGKS